MTMRRFAGLSSTIVLALGLAAFASSALAGNGNGNGNANGHADATAPTAPAAASASQASAPGNSENAPGQVKKEQASTTSSQAATSSSGGGSASQNVGTQAGVKPTNATAKDARCGPVGGSSSSATCAPTGTAAANTQSAGKADASKRYGNGRTAAQIAMQNGATGARLHGPGNSQPHKATLCPGSKHEVDVHALKGKRLQKGCGTTSSSPPTTVSHPPTTSSSPNVSSNQVLSAQVSHGAAGTTAGSTPTTRGNPHGGVLGAGASQSQQVGGVLGAIEAVGHGVLPFTGFPLWLAALAGVALLALGLTLRRHARVTV